MKYVPELDGLRGLAILSVLAHHLTLGIRGGWLGVDIFFVLSGYLITSLLLAEHDQTSKIDLKAFYLRRALRLLPAVTVLLLVYAIYKIGSGANLNETARTVITVQLYGVNWAQALNWPVELYLLGHTWSLSVEEQFYLLWPLLLLTLLRIAAPGQISKILMALIACIALHRAYLYYSGASWAHLYAGSDTRADALLIGALLSFSKSRFERSRAITTISVLLILFAVIFASPLSSLFPLGGFTVFAIMVAICLARVLANHNQALSFSPLVWIGRISYGLYLWHYPIIQANLLPSQSSVLRFAFNLGASLTLAILSFRFVEKPFLTFKDRRFGQHTRRFNSAR